jgi:hypothetical protein
LVENTFLYADAERQLTVINFRGNVPSFSASSQSYKARRNYQLLNNAEANLINCTFPYNSGVGAPLNPPTGYAREVVKERGFRQGFFPDYNEPASPISCRTPAPR